MAYDYLSTPFDDRRLLSEFLRLDGAPSGVFDASVDGSGTPQEFLIQPSLLGLPFIVLDRILVVIEDSANLSAEDYGAIAGPVVDAVRVSYTKDGTDYFLDGGAPIQSNVGWAERCFDVVEHSFGTGANFVTARWTFSKAHPVILRGTDQFKVVIGADLTGLDAHTFMLQGWSI